MCYSRGSYIRSPLVEGGYPFDLKVGTLVAYFLLIFYYFYIFFIIFYIFFSIFYYFLLFFTYFLLFFTIFQVSRPEGVKNRYFGLDFDWYSQSGCENPTSPIDPAGRELSGAAEKSSN